MRLSNAEKMRYADSAAIEDRGIPSTRLMERAAGFLLQEALRIAGENRLAVIFCGSGNNGGDGVCVAGLLLRHGFRVRTLLCGSREHMTKDCREMERRLNILGCTLEEFREDDETVADSIDRAGVVIDALFGIGLSREISGRARCAIERMNASTTPVLAADIASGVEANTGRILGIAVQAAVTVTFSMAKPGHVCDPGSAYCGRLVIGDIGIPEDLLATCGTDNYAITGPDVRLAPRVPLSHKGDYGKVLLIGGSVGYTGAPSLCAKACVAAGAGLVYLGVPEHIYTVTAVKNDEAMPFPLPDTESGMLSEKAIDTLRTRLSACDVVAAGPGLGRSEDIQALVRFLLTESTVPVVLDADALPTDLALLDACPVPVILTPHEGEFLRIGGTLTGNRIEDARAFATKYHCYLVLKGHHTVIAFPDGEVHINTTGNPGMAKGGSGDVLSGILAALLGQFDIPKALCTGVYLHGLAGDLCRDERGELSVTASDLIAYLAPASLTLQATEHYSGIDFADEL